jgi:4-nitrophenyl phosphatase
MTFKALLLDMDGVLWLDSQAIGDLPSILKRAEDKDLELAYVTNNATRTVSQYLTKFEGFGIEAKQEQIYTSALAVADFLFQKFPQGGKLFIIGENGLEMALKDRGFTFGDEDCLAVVVGLDRTINYEKLMRASLLVREGLPLIGTNPDRTLPTPKGLAPGAGSIIAAIESASGQRAQIMGKPEPTLLLAALTALKLEPSQALMVGDRLDTDIVAGQRAGCATALVLSGASKRAEAEAWQPSPDYVEADLSSLLEKI